MSAKLKEIWRYPIKGFGREKLDYIEVLAGKMLPWDRNWAITHERSKIDKSNWHPCANFLRGAIFPAEVAVECNFNPNTNMIEVEHPSLAKIKANLSSVDGQKAITDYANSLVPPLAAAGIFTNPNRGMSDTDYPSISLINLASLQEFGLRAGEEISPLR